MSSTRRIASNLLWRDGKLLRNPLVTVDGEGRIVSVETCSEPDRMARTEFWAGVLVPDFPEDYEKTFGQIQMHPGLPLPRLLLKFTSSAVPAPPHSSYSGTLVVISGLDYDTLCLTPQSQIRKLTSQTGR